MTDTNMRHEYSVSVNGWLMDDDSGFEQFISAPVSETRYNDEEFIACLYGAYSIALKIGDKTYLFETMERVRV